MKLSKILHFESQFNKHENANFARDTVSLIGIMTSTCDCLFNRYYDLYLWDEAVHSLASSGSPDSNLNLNVRL